MGATAIIGGRPAATIYTVAQSRCCREEPLRPTLLREGQVEGLLLGLGVVTAAIRLFHQVRCPTSTCLISGAAVVWLDSVTQFAAPATATTAISRCH